MSCGLPCRIAVLCLPPLAGDGLTRLAVQEPLLISRDGKAPKPQSQMGHDMSTLRSAVLSLRCRRAKGLTICRHSGLGISCSDAGVAPLFCPVQCAVRYQHRHPSTAGRDSNHSGSDSKSGVRYSLLKGVLISFKYKAPLHSPGFSLEPSTSPPSLNLEVPLPPCTLQPCSLEHC